MHDRRTLKGMLGQALGQKPTMAQHSALQPAVPPTAPPSRLSTPTPREAPHPALSKLAAPIHLHRSLLLQAQRVRGSTAEAALPGRVALWHIHARLHTHEAGCESMNTAPKA